MLKDLLEEGKCFKLVCGAGNEDTELIKRLVYIYALAGCKFFDISANIEVLNTAKNALSLANVSDAFICSSVGIKEDPHAKKAVIDYDKCVNCGACESVCLQGAIHNAKINRNRCIGCGKCWRVCSRAAISYEAEDKNLEQILPDLVNEGIDCIELHAVGGDSDEVYSKWNIINNCFGGLLSVCISRSNLSDDTLISRIEEMIKNRPPYSVIVQADGFAMSGGEDSYKATLQAVAIGELIQNERMPVYLMLSGGTNSKTAELAKLCGVKFDGIAIGSFARKIVSDYISQPDFWDNNKNIEEAVSVAEQLINTVTKE